MSWLLDLGDLLGKLRFYNIVQEYEQGLYYRRGVAIERRVKLNRSELEEIASEKKAVIRGSGGYKAFLPFRRPKIQDGYRSSKLTGFPINSKRYRKDKILRPGFYFHLPIIEHIVTDTAQEKVLNVGVISIPTTDEEPHSKVVMLSCNIRYELKDIYRAYTAVDEYEDSLKDHTLSILAKYSRGKRYDDWKLPDTIEELEKKVLDELRKIVTEKWGLKIHDVYITDHAASTAQRHVYEGHPVIMHSVSNNDSNEKT
ncbi:MAG: SPFH domain-containing protein [Nanoarchaeota archaeon]